MSFVHFYNYIDLHW